MKLTINMLLEAIVDSELSLDEREFLIKNLKKVNEAFVSKFGKEPEL